MLPRLKHYKYIHMVKYVQIDFLIVLYLPVKFVSVKHIILNLSKFSEDIYQLDRVLDLNFT